MGKGLNVDNCLKHITGFNRIVVNHEKANPFYNDGKKVLFNENRLA